MTDAQAEIKLLTAQENYLADVLSTTDNPALKRRAALQLNARVSDREKWEKEAEQKYEEGAE